MMDRAQFWEIIEASKSADVDGPDAQIEHIFKQLIKLDQGEIVEFDRIFSQYHDQAYTWDLWGAAYLIGGGCSDDGFADFRGWLISQGQKVYEDASVNSETLDDVLGDTNPDCQVEGFEYIAKHAWDSKKIDPTAEIPFHDFRRNQEPSGIEWDEDGDFGERFPKLAARYLRPTVSSGSVRGP